MPHSDAGRANGSGVLQRAPSGGHGLARVGLKAGAATISGARHRDRRSHHARPSHGQAEVPAAQERSPDSR